jgi:hypothetical protein
MRIAVECTVSMEEGNMAAMFPSMQLLSLRAAECPYSTRAICVEECSCCHTHSVVLSPQANCTFLLSRFVIYCDVFVECCRC